MRLTLEHFEASAARNKRLRPRTLTMARAILVDGRSAACVGRECRVSRQAAHRASRKILALFYEVMECPVGWEVLQLKLPPILANHVRALEREQLTLHKLGAGKPLQAVSQ